ncbi:MAG: hypothetical protein VB024_10830 [Dysgonamonadaceae bacterium]|jgi:hypothetical protein|nr:hypothetical protein [Dysgonamonadaceae bacterium]MDD3309790.1 hypothetical protein [Dysgonamonadaceae bacterium]MDD3900010.1 hypothetical protein [Dysgonamonadaceae bacterium]MDD4398760.1 hypothetical protein [Dysgonamonadaceae bacterium]MEA5082099.1 hypothetical protein [Dysgonamonadaceae bacterium]
MKTYKLSSLEKLQLEKKRLKEEQIISGQRLSYKIQYLSDNWGMLLTKGVTNSIKNKFMSTTDGLSSKSTMAPPTSPFGAMGFLNNISGLTGVANTLKVIGYSQMGSIIWKIAKPLLLTFATRKVSSLLFGRYKRKR